MTKEEIFKLIREWEMNAGESFTDYFGSDMNELTFMTWCFGKGYINREQYNLWVKNMHTLEGNDANYYVYNGYGEDVPWAVISSDWNEEDFEKAYMVLAEFISEIDAYQIRLKKFLEEN